MNFDLDESHRIIRATAQRFAHDVIAPRAYELATSTEVPYDLIAKMGEVGFMGIPFARAHASARACISHIRSIAHVRMHASH